MYEVFFKVFNEKVPLTEQEENIVKQYLTLKKLRKNQYLLQEGDICKSLCVIEKGALKAYVLDETGQERITAFAFEGWTMGDLHSFIKEKPATLNIDALEDCELVLITRQAFNELLERLPKFERYIRILMTDAYMALQKRTTNMLSLTLEDRYTTLLEVYPTLAQRVPQHMIASYMGLSKQTLSRVKSRISNKK